MSRAYYNEFDPFAAAWLRNLIDTGAIADGDVDDRSILEVAPSDLAGYTQCHFFAGIGVWSYALREAGWPDSREVWTGSCPCQPFSVAGKGAGTADERHLWPEFFRLIEKRRPNVVFGEQVASKGGLAWFDTVQTDLEGQGYAVGKADTCAAGFGAPHIRQRLYFVADTHGEGLEGRRGTERGIERPYRQAVALCVPGGLDDAVRLGNGEQVETLCAGRIPADLSSWTGATRGFWADADWLYCRDEKYRPVEPGTFPLAHGATSRVGRLRAYGNAINAKQAQGFVEAYLELGR